MSNIEFAPDLPIAAYVDDVLPRRLDTYEIRKVEWLDKPFFQRAAFIVLAGRKGTCKGTYVCGLTARASIGELYDEPKQVLVVTSEDSVELDFLPRFIAAGGDPQMVTILSEGFRLPTDCELLERIARELGNVGLIVVDPIGNHLGGANTDREGVVREAINPLNGMSDRLDCMIVGVRHLSKDVSRVLMRTSDSENASARVFPGEPQLEQAGRRPRIAARQFC